MKNYKLFIYSAVLFIITFFTSCNLVSSEPLPDIAYKNIILIIGDGMGSEQIKAAGYYKYGEEGLFSFEQFSDKSYQTTFSANSEITDSAASATAMATGEKVKNGVISKEIPGRRAFLTTILEEAQNQGKLTGLVTTTYSVHATPAAFAAHVTNRSNYDVIGYQYMNSSRPDVIFAGGHESLSVQLADYFGYTTVTDKTSLNNLTYTLGSRYFGYFGNGHLPYIYDGMGSLPELSDMALKAIELLEQSDEGFFLMIEGGRIDHAGHSNDLIRNIYEVIELADTVEKVVKWAEDHPNTIIIVTADHETGGLSVLQNNEAGNLPDVKWSTKGHTAISVPVYLWGGNSQNLKLQIKDNTDIFHAFFSYP